MPLANGKAYDAIINTGRVATHGQVSPAATDHGWLDRVAREVLDPERELLTTLSKRRDAHLRLRWRDHEYASAYEQLVGPIIGCPWEGQPAPGDDSQRAVDAAGEFTEELERSPGWPLVLEYLGEWPHRGWGGIELNGRLGGLGDVTRGEPLISDEYDTRPTEIPSFALTWETESGRPRLLTRAEPYWGVPLDQPQWRDKFLVGTWGSTEGGNWRGSGIALRAWFLSVIARKLWKDWASANEIRGNPRYRAKITRQGHYTAQATRLKNLLNDTIANGGAFILPDYVDLDEIGAQSAFDSFGHMMEAVNAATHKAILGQTLTTEQGATGALALGKVHAEQLTDRQVYVIRSFRRWLRPLARRWSLLKYGTDLGIQVVPRFEEHVDEALQIQRMEFAATQGVAMLKDEVYERLRATRPPETAKPEELMFTAPSGAGAPGMAPLLSSLGGGLSRFAEVAHPQIVAQEQDALDAIVGEVTRAAGAQVGEQIRRLIAARLRSGKRPAARV